MRSPARVTLALAIAIAPLPSTVAAQDVTVHATTDTRFYGALGKMMSFAARMGGGGKDADKASTTYMSGHRMRTDNALGAVIFDVDAGRMIMVDHKEKSYTSMTFAEMAEMASRAQDSMKVAVEKAKAQEKDPAAKGDVKMDYKVSVDRPGDKSKIAGYDAERLFMTITMRADVTPEGEKTQEAGKMIFFIDEWISKDAAQVAAMKEFSRAYGEKVGKAFREEARSMQAAFASNPQIKEGVEAAARERAKLPGVSLRSTSYVVFVPADMEFDRKLALSDGASAPAATEEKKSGGGLRGMMRGIQKAAEEANKSGDKPAAPPKQSTMLSATTEVESVDKGAVNGSMFAPPAGYREKKVKMER